MCVCAGKAHTVQAAQVKEYKIVCVYMCVCVCAGKAHTVQAAQVKEYKIVCVCVQEKRILYKQHRLRNIKLCVCVQEKRILYKQHRLKNIKLCVCLQEKRKLYEQQHQRMEEQGVSFLDSIRQDVE